MPRSELNSRYVSRSKQGICLQSCPRAGSDMRLNVIGHFKDTLIAVCSIESRSLLLDPVRWPFGLKCFLILLIHASAGSRRRRRRP